VEQGLLWWGRDGEAKYPRLKNFLTEMNEGVVPVDIWSYEDSGTTDEGGLELKGLFGAAVFDNPKPTRLIKRMLRFFAANEDQNIVLDFFCGSGSTADAVLQNNTESRRKDRFIVVQLPEDSRKGDYSTVADIAKERIRRRGLDLRARVDSDPNSDIGFRVFKVDESNFSDVYYTPEATRQSDLLSHTENIKDGRTAEDLLFQVMVDWGLDLALRLEKQTILGKDVYFVDGNALAACFEQDLTEDLAKEVAKRKPLRAVFRDSSFVNDSAKINVEQIFKLLSPTTEVKAL